MQNADAYLHISITRAKTVEDSSRILYWPQLPSGWWCPVSGKCVFHKLRNCSVKGPWFSFNHCSSQLTAWHWRPLVSFRCSSCSRTWI